jgi:hypothetical protein
MAIELSLVGRDGLSLSSGVMDLELAVSATGCVSVESVECDGFPQDAHPHLVREEWIGTVGEQVRFT